jgi:hypothetical protein
MGETAGVGFDGGSDAAGCEHPARIMTEARAMVVIVGREAAGGMSFSG